MKVIEKFFGELPRPALTRGRVWFAVAVALVIDALQFGFGPFGWAFVDEGLDIVGMIVISWAIGFHMLLLPTFIIEFIPGPDMLPTWTACTAAVILIRKRNSRRQEQPPIDIVAEVTSVPSSEPRGNAATGARAGCPPPKLSNQS